MSQYRPTVRGERETEREKGRSEEKGEGCMSQYRPTEQGKTH